jgi:capsular polysaccharide biosynthesis protein
VPRAPVWPNTRLNLIVALFGGGVLAVALAIGLHFLRQRLDTPDEIGDSLGLPVLGITPKIAGL